jgi:hypothetical protein
MRFLLNVMNGLDKLLKQSYTPLRREVKGFVATGKQGGG